ncbi:MAG: phosphoesterase [Novosphingobium sp. 17-62-19]|uniref:ligase-associated DNA damage response endonuclease PdeM n=1 Tax=Novosphingobium sp. 17-62-19 TaxID=1970406 RepID=UPI000BC4779C|nr:ligase-associated DNA damage response endonuclease PdeM [Novosphingobium sp. 17-62-19]OYX94763.1 MAG: phosphoesterase [Novosphingobium sp. 35-62-5]OZA17425.1 MAG: phosphoesterase [Novosphingobium sp. 17-62-19]HQS97577.1 ligase-associated DNA damage response endonuclease PdeM [Novosphingobium sp.]
MVPFSFASQEFRLGAARALFWAEENALLVADLHLEKASFFAKHGQMLPPYDSRATLERLAGAVRETGARRVFCLGDSFHDANAVARMEPHAAGMLDALTRATDWVWITGNHDEDAAAPGGTVVDDLDIRGLKLRHIARNGSADTEVSGHFHPKLRVTVRGRSIARPCAVASENRLILPAFGALSGGMDAGDPTILAALQPARAIDAIVPAGEKLARFALWRAAA